MPNFNRTLKIADMQSNTERILVVTAPNTVVSLDRVYSCQVSSESDLDDSIILRLEQTNDDIGFFPMPEDEIEADAGENSNHLRTLSFQSKKLYLYVDKQSATVGTLKIQGFGG